MSLAHPVALPRDRGLRPMPLQGHRFLCASTENDVPSAAHGSLPTRKKSLAHISMCKGRKIPRYHPDSCQNVCWQTLIYTVTGITRCSLLKALRTLFNSKTPVRNSIIIWTWRNFQPVIPSLWWNIMICGQMPAPSTPLSFFTVAQMVLACQAFFIWNQQEDSRNRTPQRETHSATVKLVFFQKNVFICTWFVLPCLPFFVILYLDSMSGCCLNGRRLALRVFGGMMHPLDIQIM